nr:LysR family transcriptional regulator [Shimia sp. CNT1-13L.2]
MLCAVQDNGGITRASEHLALTQSAVSHRIRRLEQSIGCALLTRRPGGPIMTAEGQRLLDYARRIVALHDEALGSISKQPLSGRIRLGMTEDVTSSDLSRILGRFTRLHPEVTVRTQVRQSLTLQDALQVGEIDLGIMQVFTHQVMPGDEVVYTDTLHWVKAQDLVIEEGGRLPFLAYDDACFFYQWAMQLPDLPLETVLQCASSAGIASAVQAGLGVSLLPGRYVTGEMAILDDMFPKVPGLSYVVRTGPRSRTRHVRALAREVVAGVSQFASLRVA